MDWETRNNSIFERQKVQILYENDSVSDPFVSQLTDKHTGKSTPCDDPRPGEYCIVYKQMYLWTIRVNLGQVFGGCYFDVNTRGRREVYIKIVVQTYGGYSNQTENEKINKLQT